MPTQTINIAELIADKIKVRYAEITERTMGSQNMVCDAFYPTYVRESLTNGNMPTALSKRASAISPFIASELNLYQVPFDDIVKMLGYKKLNLKATVDAVKAKHLELVLVGLGGTGMNFMHWGEELCNYVNSVNVFKRLMIYDQDAVDLTNMFRFPKILNPYNQYLNEGGKLFKVDAIPNSSVLSDSIFKERSFIRHGNIARAVSNQDGSPRLSSSWTSRILYGAPDIATREMFSQFKDLKFISGTHGNDDCQLYIKPMQDSTIQIESYGMINLSVFFMNQIKMTIAFFELLASDTDLTVPNLVMEYSFAKEYSNNRINKAGLSRAYTFPITTENFLDQEVNIPQQPTEQSEPLVVNGMTTDFVIGVDYAADVYSSTAQEIIDRVALDVVLQEYNPIPVVPPMPYLPFTTPTVEDMREIAESMAAQAYSISLPTQEEISALLEPLVDVEAEEDEIVAINDAPTTPAPVVRRRRTPAEMAEARARGEAPAYRPRGRNAQPQTVIPQPYDSSVQF